MTQQLRALAFLADDLILVFNMSGNLSNSILKNLKYQHVSFGVELFRAQ